MSTPVLHLRALFFLALGACGAFAAQAQDPQCTTGVVQTSSGPVCGAAASVTIQKVGTFTASGYRGIPYAAPPVGSLRWRNPTPFPKSTVTLQATAFQSMCPQATVTSTGGEVPPMNQCTNGKVLGPNQSEDCLYLNVWVPSGATASSRLPAMVFIHGGAFFKGSGGSASLDPYDGTYLAAAGNVIVVTFNYRLGALGFLAQAGNFNFGFADQILALQWVQENIASFGGNPSNVTLFGESAGAMSVGLHALSSPKSSGLFQAAIMESNPLGLPYKNTTQAEALSTKFCGDVACTVATTTCDILQAQESFAPVAPLIQAGMSDSLLWAPVVDGTYILNQPIASAASLRVPLIVGTNSDEGVALATVAEQRTGIIGFLKYPVVLDDLFGPSNSKKIRSLKRYHCGSSRDCTTQLANVITDYAFTCANRRFAIQASQSISPQPIYMYLFAQVPSFNLWSPPNYNVPACSDKVCHGAELPYVFNTAGQFGKTFLPAEEVLSQNIGAYWTSFAANHAPSGTWPLFKTDNTYLLLKESSAPANDPLAVIANCSTLWDQIGYEVPLSWNSLIKTLDSKGKRSAP